MLFLTFIVNVLMMVYKNQDLLRASIVSAGNSHRLGANEAPPAILSIFLGRHLSHMLDEVVARLSDAKLTPDEKKALQLGISRIPAILQDNTDRNRTSPLCFHRKPLRIPCCRLFCQLCCLHDCHQCSHGSPTERIQGHK